MFLYNSFDIVIKTALVTFLLIQPAVVTAQAADSSNRAEAAESFAGNPQKTMHRKPRWPRHRPSAISNRASEPVPPPPTGPYMSSALSPFSVSGPSFTHHADGASVNVKKPLMEKKSMEAFNPDTPWPSSSKSKPNRWLPDDGYQYVQPSVSENQYPVGAYNPRANYSYGYNYRQVPNNGYGSSYQRNYTAPANSVNQYRSGANRAP